MFLKRVEMQGFKSFADKVVIEFDNEITGIVGPNGCGKSNITDAIRWVLGEQSVKNLRGSSMIDVIFAGSVNRNKVNVAEVTLVFDNSKHALNSNLDEIEITRRLYRDSGESEYCINRKNCRLKDIIDLILDTGIGKDSLSMISQGNIVQFADAKPIERRAIFEEAAGVAKYKKRKMETLSRLTRTKENIDRCVDIVNELERQVVPLEKAAKKALIYREKKQRLQEIEVAVLVDEIDRIKESIESNQKLLFDLETKQAMAKANLNLNDTNGMSIKKQINELDKQINQAQERLMLVVNDIARFEQAKIQMDEKRKYAIEQGSNEEKIKSLTESLKQYEIEYNDRQSRYDALVAQLELLGVENNSLAQKFTLLNQQRFEENGRLNRFQSRMAVLENTLKEPFNHQAGVKSIMEHQSSLNGVLGVVGQCLTPHIGYEQAINVALGGSLYHIVTENEASARYAIQFLKQNKSGRATFLPLTVCKAHRIYREHEIIAQNCEGYLGLASDFVQCESLYDPVVLMLLANVLVVDNLENGNKLANLLQYNYKIVDLDGDVIHKGGSMTGGQVKNNTSLLTAKAQYESVKLDYESQNAKCQLIDKQINELVDKRNENESKRLNLQIEIAQLEPIVSAKKASYYRVKQELDALAPNLAMPVEESANDTSLIEQLNKAYQTRDDLTADIKLKREQRIRLNAENERKDGANRGLRKTLDDINGQINSLKVELARLETRLESNMDRLASAYALTYEYAKANTNVQVDIETSDEVVRLRHEIDALGNVNMSAPEEFEKVNERYQTLKNQVDDLLKSRDRLLNAIDQLDEVMSERFYDMFKRINANLDSTFKDIFGGGKAKLVLEDSNDILNTGIDIDIQPPGKAIQNIRLFSGGEKSLIAICVLFAILKVKCVPLVIFDEVEAALDQANVERFAKYIRNFTPQTQFIVVTHRPGTMEQADVLYGVTMQHQGVSQMLKVELKQAIDLADETERKVS